MIGYHYTTKSNWEKIKIQGLIPYEVHKDELKKYFPRGVKAIWVWRKSFRGLGHTGSIIFQAQKGDTSIVKLKVEYDFADILRSGHRIVEIQHWGNVGNLLYHTGNEKAYLITEKILPEKIKLVKEFDLIKLLK